MYYPNGNYEAFACPKRPENVESKSAYIVGSGLVALSTAVFPTRDAQMPGEHVCILEELSLPGGSMDGIKNDHLGYTIRGGREIEPHFKVLWDLFRSTPSLENPENSILDEFYWLNKGDPCYAKTRVIHNRGKAIPGGGQLILPETAIKEIIDLVLTPEKQLEDTQINQVFGEEFFASNFWFYWSTIFALELWSSATKMRHYLICFVQHVDALKDLSSLRFTKFN